jgi:hypothetical protein
MRRDITRRPLLALLALAVAGVGPLGREGVHFGAHATRFGDVLGVRAGGLGFEPQCTSPPPALGGLVEREADCVGVVVALVAQHGQIIFGALIQSSLHGAGHRGQRSTICNTRARWGRPRSGPECVAELEESVRIAARDV